MKGDGTVHWGLPGVDYSPRTDNSAGSHVPVLLNEVLEFMAPESGKNFIDSTGGPGNMSHALLERTAPDGRVLTIDCDKHANEQQEALLGKYGSRSIRVLANFSSILSIVRDHDFTDADGVLYDLGLSSAMLDIPGYGMSIRHDAKLDMRYSSDIEISAYELVNNLSENELVEILRGMDERRFARRIARSIVREREREPVETTGQLAKLVESAIPRRFHPRNIHPATRTFIALRAMVNSERENLERSLNDCLDVLKLDGVLVVICYSSFEDRILKESIRNAPGRWKKLTRKIVQPSAAEVETNPRSRSARLRAYRKVA